MPKVSSIKIYNMQSKQNRTCSLDDIIKENIKNNKSLSQIDLTKTNDFDLSNDNAIFYDHKYKDEIDEVDYPRNINEINLLIKNEEKDSVIVDNESYDMSLKLSEDNIKNIITSNHSIFNDFANGEEIKNDKFSNHKNYISTDKLSSQIHFIKYEHSLIKKENTINKLSISNPVDASYITTLVDTIDLGSRGQNKKSSVNNLFHNQEINLTANYETIPVSYKNSNDYDYHNTFLLSKKTFNKNIELPLFENSLKNKNIKNSFINSNENRELKYYFKKWGKTHYVDISISKNLEHYPLFSFCPSDSLVDNRIHNYLNSNNSCEKNFFIIKQDNKDEDNEKSDKYRIVSEDEE
ncbi:hypothetical protein QE177_03425 [Arsenophonus sp. aPb]|uniref:SpaN/EivJ family type III secretion system needle length determinant n=1 Tax=Arsenophonus sp. aPb TaxID=3041619 RepID=UPI0024686555|nr:hypothetical protein [Arsenophonus sp. aPb]WGL98960.1 hypothetical protein QE177_03425 [Arsenophonus sp. aPb]